MDTILSIQPRDSGEGGGAAKSTDEIVKDLAIYFTEKLPVILNTAMDKGIKILFIFLIYFS